MGKRHYFGNGEAQAWKCAHKDNIHDIGRDCVTGMAVYKYHHSTCYEARSLHGLCGPEGKLFLKYEHVPHNPSGLNLGKAKPSKTAEDLLSELEKT